LGWGKKKEGKKWSVMWDTVNCIQPGKEKNPEGVEIRIPSRDSEKLEGRKYFEKKAGRKVHLQMVGRVA